MRIKQISPKQIAVLVINGDKSFPLFSSDFDSEAQAILDRLGCNNSQFKIYPCSCVFRTTIRTIINKCLDSKEDFGVLPEDEMDKIRTGIAFNQNKSKKFYI